MLTLLRKALVSVPCWLRFPIRVFLGGFLGCAAGFAVVKAFPNPLVYWPLCILVGLAVGVVLGLLGVRWEQMGDRP